MSLLSLQSEGEIHRGIGYRNSSIVNGCVLLIRVGLDAEFDVRLCADVGVFVETGRAEREIEATGAVGTKGHTADLVGHLATKQSCV